MNIHDNLKSNEQIASELVEELSSVTYAESYGTVGWQKMKAKAKKEILLANRDIVLLMIEQLKHLEQPASGMEILNFCLPHLKNDTAVISNALIQNGWNLEHLNAEQKDNEELVFLATKENGNTIKFASKRLQNNRDFVIETAKHSAYVLEHVSPILQDDKELVLLCVKSYGMSLQYASSRLMNDKEVALAAITKTANAINAISKQLREEIGANEPITYLKSAILSEKLHKNLPIQQDNIKAKCKI